MPVEPIDKRKNVHTPFGRAVCTFPVLLGLSLFAGCGLDLEKPYLDLPAKYDNPTSKTLHPVSSPGDFSVFHSKRLTDLIEKARSCNFDIAAAIARIKQADAQVRIATQPLIPSLEFTGNASQSYRGIGAARGRTTDVIAQLDASYEIDFWGKNRAGRNSAKASAFSSRFDAVTVAITTDGDVADNYFQAVAVRKRIEIAKKNLGIAVQTLDAIKARQKAGTASGLDVAQQETLVANVKVTIPPLEQNFEQFKHALAVLTGLPPESFTLSIDDLFAIKIPRIEAGLPSDLLLRRPDIAKAEADLAASRFDVQAARAALFPSIELTGSGGFESTALRTLFSPNTTFYQMALGITQPILNAYQLRAQLDLDKARYEELLKTYLKAILSAFQDVEDSLVAYKKTAEQERLQQEAVNSARRAYEISSAQLRSGIIDVTTLLQVQQTLFAAEDALAQVRLARLQAAVSLYRALGGGWQKPVDETEIAEIPKVVEVGTKAR